MAEIRIGDATTGLLLKEALTQDVGTLPALTYNSTTGEVHYRNIIDGNLNSSVLYYNSISKTYERYSGDHTNTAAIISNTDNISTWDNSNNFFNFNGNILAGSSAATTMFSTAVYAEGSLHGVYGKSSSGIGTVGEGYRGVSGRTSNGIAVEGLADGSGIAGKFDAASSTTIVECLSNGISKARISNTGSYIVVGQYSLPSTVGTSGQALVSAGTNNALTWQTMSSGVTPTNGILNWSSGNSRYELYTTAHADATARISTQNTVSNQANGANNFNFNGTIRAGSSAANYNYTSIYGESGYVGVTGVVNGNTPTWTGSGVFGHSTGTTGTGVTGLSISGPAIQGTTTGGGIAGNFNIGSGSTIIECQLNGSAKARIGSTGSYIVVGQYSLPSTAGVSGQVLTSTGTNSALIWSTPTTPITPADGILDWSTISNSYVPYSENGAGKLYNSNDIPTNSTTLKYDGSFHTNFLNTYNTITSKNSSNTSILIVNPNANDEESSVLYISPNTTSENTRAITILDDNNTNESLIVYANGNIDTTGKIIARNGINVTNKVIEDGYALIPDHTGNSGKILSSNGTNTAWSTLPSMLWETAWTSYQDLSSIFWFRKSRAGLIYYILKIVGTTSGDRFITISNNFAGTAYQLIKLLTVEIANNSNQRYVLVYYDADTTVLQYNLPVLTSIAGYDHGCYMAYGNLEEN